MMTPLKASFYVYAEDEQQVKDLEDTLLEFVASQYDRGTLVTAPRLSQIITKLTLSPMVSTFLK